MRLPLVSFCSAALIVALAQGCLLSPPGSIDGAPPADPGAGTDPGTDPGTNPGNGTGTDPGPTAPADDTGLPCEVSFLLAEWCRACHSDPAIGGANVPLMSYDDLVAPMPNNPAVTVAEDSLARMRNAAAPMPPGSLLPEADIAGFAAWVEAGMPAESCAADPPPTGPNPYDTPPVCTSNVYWGKGDDGSPDMTPGRACIACHSGPGGDEGPRFLFSGTIYPTAHEPDDCNGVGGPTIEITDANGIVYTATARASGNFYKGGDPANLAWPITTRVLYEGKVFPMLTPITTGDCNACHTQDGKEGAPGRIILPP
jgi:mono/diheme cytochrome c family protein